MAKPIYDPLQIVNAITTSWGDGDTDPRSWDHTNLTFFMPTASTDYTVSGSGDEADGEQQLTQNEQQFVFAAFDEWAQIANLTFTQVSNPDDADITLAYSSTTTNDGTYTHPTLDPFDDTKIEGAAIWFSTNGFPDQQDDITYTNYGFITMLHEIGHALGLSHPGTYNAGDANLTYANDAVFAQDNRQYTIMSYFGYETDSSTGWTQDGTLPGNTTLGSEVIYPSTPMVYDMLAIQDKYGANMSTRAGDTIYGFGSNAGEDFYDFNKTPQVVFTIWDGGGNDTLNADFTGHQYVQNIDLLAGDYSSVGGLINNIGIAFGVTIENAIGGDGPDTITGNEADNHLVGNDGNDHLIGAGGNDTLDGGVGNDLLEGGPGEDTLLGGDGIDALYGGPDGDVLFGGNGDDYLDGGGNLNGGGSVDFNPDFLTGGEGDDTFVYNTDYRQTTVTDFSPDVDANSDTLDLTNEMSVHDFEDLLADASQQGTNTVFNFGGGDVLTLENFQLDTLTPDGILFSPPKVLGTGEFQLAANPYPPNGTLSYFTKTAALSNGDFAGVILDTDTYYTGEITAQVYDARGVATGQTFIVNTTQLGTDNGSVLDPDLQVVTLSNGEFVTVWQDAVGNETPGPNGPTVEIRYRVFNADGTPQGPDYVTDATSQVGVGLVSVQPTTGDPGFIINWLADVTVGSGTQGHLFTRSFGADGTPSGSAQDLGLPTSSSFPGDSVDVDTPTDGVVRIWQVNNGTTAHAYAEIVGHTDPVQLDQSSSGFVPYGSGDGPDITVSELADGDLLFTWGAGGYYDGPYYTLANFTGSESIIYDSQLQGFIKPGTSGDDILKGSPYDDQLYGLDGNDTLIGGPGADLLDGGPGSDTADYTGSLAGVNVDLTNTGPQHGGDAEGDVLVSIENVTGSDYADVITGDAGDNVINGLYGNDTIVGGGGADLIHGGAGKDNITLSGDYGGAWGDDGNDVLIVTGGTNNTLQGGNGNDSLTVDASNSNTAEGGDGADTIVITGNGDFAVGDAGDDNIDATGDSNWLRGGADDDTITLEQGNFNILDGDAGNDTITVKGTGIGNSLDGGAGNDTLSAADSTAAVSIYGEDGNDVLIGGQGDDFLDGGAGNDTISGGDGVDRVVFDSYSSDFSITYDPIKGLTVTDLRPGSPDGTDLVSNDVEELWFYDGIVGAGYFHTSAKADDGYIVGATVFADTNGNGVLDAGEASTTTDSGGGFTLPAGASGPLVLSGGADVAAGLAFRGEFLAPSGYDNINALTTVVELLTDNGGFANPEQTVLTNLGLGSTANLASADPIVGFRSGANGLEIPDVQIANTVDLIASAIEGAHPGAFNSAYTDAFHALASAIGTGPFDFADVTAVTNVIDAALAAGHFTLDSTVESGLVEIITGMNGRAAQTAGGENGLAYLSALAKVAQGDAANAVKDAGGNPSSISDAVNGFTGTALDSAINSQVGHSGDIDGAFFNNPPVTNDDSYTIKSNTQLIVDAAHGVLANDVDYDGDPITVDPGSSGAPSHGALTLNADGSFTYTPNQDFAGEDAFYYQASDGIGASYGSVYIEVDGPHPEVTGITASPDSGVLQPGDNVTVTVTMSSAVTVDQTNAPLFLETNDGWIELQSGSGTDTLVFYGPLGAYDPGQPVTITGDDNDDYDAHVTDTLSGSLADLSGAHVTFSELSVACYCRGTLIGAEGSEIAVEDLAIGDRVMTQSGPRPIKWIGRRSYTGRFVMGRKDILPICFKAGSLGDNVPSRDLWISPRHAMFLEGVLIEAKDLVNGISVVQAESVEEVEYFHIELETHDVIIAEGAPSESFVDDDSRAMFHNAHQYHRLYPGEPAALVARYCAPRLDSGYEVERVRQRIAGRAGLLQVADARAGQLRGFIDLVSADSIEGWAQNVDYPDAPVCLDIVADNQLIGQVLANRYREDLEQASIGSGHHAFAFKSPRGLKFSGIEVRRSLDGAPLKSSSKAAVM